MKNISKLLGTVAGLLTLFLLTSALPPIKTKSIDLKSSKIAWKGYKVTGEHYGSIKFKSGALEFSENKLNGGYFVIDMNTINTEDLSGEYKNKLDGHLKSDDFFGVKQHPEASLKFTKVTPKGKDYVVEGDLNIKGKTNPITFNMTVHESHAKAKLTIDRTLYNIKYGSASFFDNLKDRAISNEFDIEVDLVF